MKLLASRIFLHHFKFLNNPGAKLMDNSSEFIQKLQEIDGIPLKEIIEIPVLYIADPGSEPFEIMPQNDLQFNELLEGIGTVLTEAHIRTGNYEMVKEYVQDIGLIHSADYFSDVFFLCPSIKHTGKVDLFNGKNVFVLWNAREKDKGDTRMPLYLHRKLSKEKEKLIIVLTPLRNGLCKVNVFITEDDGIIICNFIFILVVNKVYAPLYNNMIVGMKWLPMFLTQSCKIYSKYKLNSNRALLEPKKEPLEDISNKQQTRKM
eukprot:TRINITY_DN9786_c0_g1_i1.p1 TRINITY_DN9786_c0_g1~~TRINITY_DN9786_c0_g1_i1.p1  ORF type:complete len:262 (+),score=51.31 TRINITY_DN9786_c0_g1_i1:101-886(+)